MTVNPAVPVQLDRAAAERRATRIRRRLDDIADAYAGVMPLIREAIEKRDDLALGYRSVSEYVADRFGGALTRLGVEVRREVVRELTEAGMSTRAIAPVVGASVATVKRDVHAGGSHEPPEPKSPAVPSAGAASATRPEPTPQAAPEEEESTAAAAQRSTSDPTAATPEHGTPAPPRAPVVGLDGKTYQRPTPRPRPTPPSTSTSSSPDDGPNPAPAEPEGLGRVLRAAARAIDDVVTMISGRDGTPLLPADRRALRRTHERLADVVDQVDPATDDDLDAAAADIAARADVDPDTARWIARKVRDRNTPSSSLAAYVRRISVPDLLARYAPPAAPTPGARACRHGRAGGHRIVGHGADASRVCDRCEVENPAATEVTRA